MTTHLAGHFRAARLARGLTLGGLARLAGYRRVRRAAGRIARFERHGVVGEELLARLADALGIDLFTVEELLARDGGGGAAAGAGDAPGHPPV
ncbi:MAG: hypothetical protein C0501_31195 [Isosphaera sp.]|nr:hypothetical protein [Isosphaera sp.]